MLVKIKAKRSLLIKIDKAHKKICHLIVTALCTQRAIVTTYQLKTMTLHIHSTVRRWVWAARNLVYKILSMQIHKISLMLLVIILLATMALNNRENKNQRIVWGASQVELEIVAIVKSTQKREVNDQVKIEYWIHEIYNLTQWANQLNQRILTIKWYL